MRRIVFAILLGLLGASRAEAAEHGRYITYSLLHAIGSETYDVNTEPNGSVMIVVSTLSDRGSTRASTTVLTLAKTLPRPRWS